MCHKSTCRRCGKATWSGCGNHIELALKGVPQAQRCVCPDESSSGGFFARLLNR